MQKEEMRRTSKPLTKRQDQTGDAFFVSLKNQRYLLSGDLKSPVKESENLSPYPGSAMCGLEQAT